MTVEYCIYIVLEIRGALCGGRLMYNLLRGQNRRSTEENGEIGKLRKGAARFTGDYTMGNLSEGDGLMLGKIE